MALYAQHGHAKSDKITAALDGGSIQGVVFGARNESRDNLVSCVQQLRTDYAVPLLFDPQFYVSTLTPPNDRYLTEYPYYKAGRTAADFVRASKLSEYAKETLGFQKVDLELTRLISPTVLFDTFDDRWYQISLNLADASLEFHSSLNDPAPLLLSFAFSEGALSSQDDIDSFLDQVTSWEVHGVYLIVARDEATYSQRFEDERLSRLLYLIHVLGSINGFEVVVGYADFCGVLMRAAGASAFATGWSQTLRQFHRRAFIRRPSGGQPARLRYSSKPLFNSILLSDLEQINDVGGIDLVLSKVPLDDVITSAKSPEASAWNQRTSELHHWETLRSLDSAISDNPSSDFDRLGQELEQAIELYEALKSAGVVFERNSQDQHLAEWSAAINSFRKGVGI